MNVLRLVIIEKCEVKNIEIGQMVTMAARVDIFSELFLTTQRLLGSQSRKYVSGDKLPETVKCHDPSNSNTNTNIYTTLRVPGDIKRREVELDLQVSAEEIINREVELDPQVNSEEIMSREVELGCESWTSFASGLFLNSSATDIVLVTLPEHSS